jgi:hypothetical protein
LEEQETVELKKMLACLSKELLIHGKHPPDDGGNMADFKTLGCMVDALGRQAS